MGVSRITSPSTDQFERVDAVILAAGEGTRMGGSRAKVLNPVAERPMVQWVMQACKEAGVRRCVVVVGVDADKVREALSEFEHVSFVEQAERRGTGHAAQMAAPIFEGKEPRDVFVLSGDAPLIRRRTLEQLLTTHRQTQAAATLATAVLKDPTGYGRIVRDETGQFARIVEQKDGSPRELAITEINPAYYCFRSDALFASLKEVRNDNRQGEYYLTDVPGLLKAAGQVVSVVSAVPAEDVLGVNTPEQLAEVDRLMRQRLAAVEGVR